MSYVSTPTTLAAAASNLLILDSQTGVAYDPEPDYKDLTLSGAVNTRYSNLTVSNGGILRLSRVIVDNVEVYSGGVMRAATGGTWYTVSNAKVYEGGSAFNMYTNGVTLAGADTYFALGTLADYESAYTDENGYLQNFGCAGAFTIRDGMKVDNFTARGILYMAGNAVARNVQFVSSGCYLSVLRGDYLCNPNCMVTIQSAIIGCSGVSLGGADATLAASNGITYCSPTDRGTVNDQNDTDIAISSGVITGMKLVSSGYWLKQITLLEGIRAIDPVISSGGTLSLTAGGSAIGAVLNADGSLYVESGGLASNATVAGGYIYAINGGIVSGATLNTGGIYFYSGGVVSDVTVNGGTFRAIKGGSAYGVTLNNGNMHVMDNNTAAENNSHGRPSMLVADVDVLGGQLLLRGSNASGANIRISAGDHYIQNGGGISDLTMYGGTLTMAINAGLNLKDLPYSTLLYDLHLSAGTVNANSAAMISGAQVTGGELVVNANASAFDVEIASGGKATVYGRLDVKSSAAACNVTVSTSNGVVNVSNGAELVDAIVGADGSLNVGSGGLASNATVAGGYIYAINGGIVSGATLNTGGIYFYSGGVVSDVTVNGGTFRAIKGGSAYGVTLNNGSMHVMDNNNATENNSHGRPSMLVADVDVLGGQLLLRGSNASGANIRISAGDHYIQNGGGISDLTMYGGTLTMAINAALALKDLPYSTLLYDLHLSAGKVYANSAAIVSGAQVTGGELSATNAAVYDATVAGGYIYAINGGIVSGATLNTGGIYFYSGGVVSDVTINGGMFRALKGGSAYGVTLNNGSMHVMDNNNATENNSHGRPSMLVADVDVRGGQMLLRGSNASGANIRISAGDHYIQNGGGISGLAMYGGTLTMAINAALALKDLPYSTLLYDLHLSAGTVNANSAAMISGAQVTGGELVVNANASAFDVEIASGGKATVYGSMDIRFSAAARNVTISTGGIVTASNGAELVDAIINGGSALVYSGGVLNGATISTGGVRLVSGAAISRVELVDGTLNIFDYPAATGIERAAITADDVTVSSGFLFLRGSNVSGSNITTYDGITYIQNGAVADGVVISGGAVSAYLQPITGCVDYNVSGATVKNAVLSAGELFVGGGGTAENLTVAGGELTLGNGFTFAGDINFAEGTLTNDADAKAANGVIENLDLSIDGNFGSGITLSNFTQSTGVLTLVAGAELRDGAISAGSAVFNEQTQAAGFAQFGGRVIVRGSDAAIDGATVYGGNMSVGNGGALNDTTISGGTVVVRHVAGWAYNDNLTATASNILVEDGATLQLESGGILESGKLAAGADLTIYKGGKAALSSAAAGAEVNISFWDVNAGHGNTEAIITDWGDFSTDAKVKVYSLESGYSYKIADVANANVTLDCGSYRTIFDDNVKTGEQYSNAFLGRNLDFSDGMTLVVSDFTVGVAEAAAKFSATTATTLADGGFAAKWNGDTTYAGGNLTIADASLNGNVWLTLEGFDQSAANIYGAEGAFAHDVNMWLYDGTVKNLAGGAKLGGSVENVNILISDTGENGMTIANMFFAGGMGDVTGEIETIVHGGEFGGNVFAGALCNCAANNLATSTGNISFTVNGGTLKSNLFAGAAVKAGTATNVIHTADDITLELNGGTTTKGAFCVYGGGYATGTTEDALVYTAGDVALSVNDGSWGIYQSGRGIFGGVYADKVAASVENVEISVTGGTMGNIYGGGWAQNGGNSTAGDVTITVAGSAAVTNVFGGGSYSSVSGGVTSVDNVTILVAGGSIANNIFAAGQGEYSTVTGDISVTFTGSNDYTCNVYGYGTPTGATTSADKTLAFAGYTGTISGAIGGFDGITFTGNTSATLTGAIDNSEWSFDYTDRTASAATAMLTLDDGALTGNVAVDLASVEQVENGWNIAGGISTATATFGVELSTGSAANLGLDTALDDSYGIYEGWGFTLEESTLKFKQLA